MDEREKAEELFDTERDYQNESSQNQMQKFDFDDIMVEHTDTIPVVKQEEAPRRKKKKKAYEELDLDGNPVGGTEEQRLKQYKRDQRRAAGTVLSGIFSWVKELAIALLIVWFVLTFVAQNNKVVGSSMQPTVYANDMIIVNKFIYRFTNPVRGDIVVFPAVDNGKKVFFIKRIIGLPGDVGDIRDGKVFINDIELVEKYIDVETTPVSGQVTFPLTVPEGEYFVLGDNRIVSKDSRYLSVGTIPKSKLTGKASIRIWPFKSIGFVE